MDLSPGGKAEKTAKIGQTSALTHPTLFMACEASVNPVVDPFPAFK
jgi:hypothetical protein